MTHSHTLSSSMEIDLYCNWQYYYATILFLTSVRLLIKILSTLSKKKELIIVILKLFADMNAFMHVSTKMTFKKLVALID